MKIVRFLSGTRVQYGTLEDKIIRLIKGDPFSNPLSFLDTRVSLDEVNLLSPVEPTKVIAVGLNYIDHAKELNMSAPDEPILFIKPSSTVIGPEEPIVYPSTAKQVDYEAELAVVIKRKIKNVCWEEVPYHILGYTCSNDVTARDLQRKDGQWTRSKSFDTFAPIGPWIVTDINPNNLHIELLLNSEIKQSSSTSNMIFDVFFIVSFVSEVMTLYPGDVIMTGTPFGVGPMDVGDIIEVKIEGIGSLRNKVVCEA